MNESEPKAVVEHSVEAAVQPSGAAIEALRKLVTLKLQQWEASTGTTTAPSLPSMAVWLKAWDNAIAVLDSSGSVTKRGEANEPESFEPFFREDGTSFIDDLLAEPPPGLHLALSVLAWSNEEDRRGPRVEEFRLKVIKEASGVVDSVGASVQRPAEVNHGRGSVE